MVFDNANRSCAFKVGAGGGGAIRDYHLTVGYEPPFGLGFGFWGGFQSRQYNVGGVWESIWWTQPTFPNRGTTYISGSFTGNLLFLFVIIAADA